MMKTVIVMLVTALLFYSQSSTAANNGNGNGSPGNNVWAQLEALQAQVDALQLDNPPAQISVAVDCNAGESLADAVQTPATRLDVSFSGSCFEDVSIERGNLTLTGEFGAEIQGAVDVDSEGGTVVMQSVYINNSPSTGLIVHSRSNLEAANLHVNGSTEGGISLVNATLECADCSVNNNGVDGLLMLLGSRALLGGNLEFNNNGFEGIEVSDSSSLRTAADPQSLGAAGASNNIDTSGNSASGILAYGSSAILLGDNTHLNVDQNTDGVIIATGATAHFIGTVSATNNGVGVGAIGGSIFLGSTVTATDNNIGVFVNGAGKVRGSGSAIATDNNFGIFMRSSFLDLPSIVSSNSASLAVFLEDGAIIRAANAQVTGFVLCDGTEVLSSSFVCGAN